MTRARNSKACRLGLGFVSLYSPLLTMGNLRIHLRQSINTLIYSVIVDKLSSNVENWEAIIHKIVTSKNGNLVGNVNAVDDSSGLVSTEGGRTRYRIPKHIVEGYDGHEVTLNIPDTELSRFKGDQVEGFKDIK